MKYPQTRNTLPTGLGSPSSNQRTPARAEHFPLGPAPEKELAARGLQAGAETLPQRRAGERKLLQKPSRVPAIQTPFDEFSSS